MKEPALLLKTVLWSPEANRKIFADPSPSGRRIFELLPSSRHIRCVRQKHQTCFRKAFHMQPDMVACETLHLLHVNTSFTVYVTALCLVFKLQ